MGDTETKQRRLGRGGGEMLEGDALESSSHNADEVLSS